MNAVFKKILSTFYIIFIFFLIAGCTTKNNNSNNDLKEIIIGSDEFLPYFSMKENGEFEGIDVSIAKNAFNRLGYQPIFKQIDWSLKDEYLNNGEVECLWGSFSMNGRLDKYQWAGPYLKSREVIVVRKDSQINKISELTDKRIAVQITSKPDEIFSLNTLDLADLYTYEDINLVFAALRKGYVDAIASHEIVVLENLKYETDDYKILDDALIETSLGVAFSLNYPNKELINKLNDILKQMNTDGTIDKILTDYGINYENYKVGTQNE